MSDTHKPPPRRDNKETGQTGEEIAARYLQERGCVILARNWRAAPGEIDIVARCPVSRSRMADAGSGPLYDPRTDMLAFVEVRTRHGAPGMAEESISRRKAAGMATAALHYMSTHNLDPESTPWRIDLVGIAMSGDHITAINWIKGAITEEMVEW